MFSHAALVARRGLESLAHGFPSEFSSATFPSASGDDFPSFSFGASANTTVYQAESGSNLTSTPNAFEFIEAAKFAVAKSVRTSSIILATFNSIAGFATLAWILYESRVAIKQAPYSRRMRKEILASVSSPDLFPLIVCGAIAIQGIIFAVSQSRGLDGFMGQGCTLIAHFMLPAILLVPTTQFVLGCELALRAMKTDPFQERSRWMVPICLTVIGLVCMIGFLVADFAKVEDNCFMSLFWYVSDYAVGIFIVLAGYAAIILGIVVFIFVKLGCTPRIDATERINASRMIYYLALTVLSNAFICPFFFVLGFMKTSWGEHPETALNLGMIGTIVASVSGLMTGGLHLFLRSSTISTIGSKDQWKDDEQRKSLKSKIRLRGFASSYSGSSASGLGDQSAENLMNFPNYNKMEEAGSMSAFATNLPDPPRSYAIANAVVFPQIATSVQVPEPVQIFKSHRPKPSTFSFLSRDKKASMTLLPSTTYNPNVDNGSDSKLPEKVKDDWRHRSMLRLPISTFSIASRHRRDSSNASLATVQIGLRLSNINDIPAMNRTLLGFDEKTLSPGRPQMAKGRGDVRRPSPLSKTNVRKSEEFGSDEDTVYGGGSEAVYNGTPQRNQFKDSRTKILPIETVPAETTHSTKEQEITLSAAVYSPHSPTPRSRVTSPRGVGFTTPPRKNST